MLRVSFTGTRIGATEKQVTELAAWLGCAGLSIASHGCCTGADMQFHDLVRKIYGRSVKIWVFPSTAKTAAPIPDDADYVHERLPPLDRNQLIVKAGRDQLLAVPRNDQEVPFGGTWHAVRCARKIGVPVKIFWR